MESKINNPFELIFDELKKITDAICVLRDEVRASNGKVASSDEGIGLAVNVTGLAKKTIYNLVSKKRIPFYKKGGRLYFDEQELLAWKRSGKHLALDQIEVVPVNDFPIRATRRHRTQKTSKVEFQ